MSELFEMKTKRVQVPVLRDGVDLADLNLRQLDELRRAARRVKQTRPN